MKPQIMLVDDIDISNFLLKRQLAKLDFASDVYDFTDPVKAYQSINEIDPDVIFLDLNMPVMSGWDFLDKMQREQKSNKIIILTSSISVLDKQKSKNYSNVVAFLEKPITKEVVVSCLQLTLVKDFLLT